MNNKISSLREFGKFRLDAEKRVLWYEGKPVNLALKEIELLCALTENGGEVVTKEELLDKIWHESFVEESNLSRHIYILRKTFQELGAEDLIQTIPRRGYRFTDEVREIPNGEIILERHALKQTLIEIEEDETRSPEDAETLNEPDKLESEDKTGGFLSLTGFRLGVASILILTLAGGLGFWKYRTQQAKTHLAEIKSIAVLPFKTIDANKENEHQGMGLTDILITRLSNIRELNVRPTSAVFAFQNEDSISAGQKLQVDAVLEGTIYRTNEKVRVTTRLIKISDGAPVWAGQFEKPVQDELKMQDEIALQVIYALAMDLTGNEKAALTKRFTESAEAYDLYLKGRYEWNKRSTPAMREAEKLFRSAIEKDPNFALALVGLADVLATRGDDEAGFLLGKALEIDPNLAECYATRGFIEMFNGWRWQEAETAFKKSIELNPNYATAHHWYATFLTIQGRHEEAKAEMRRALEINPLSHNFLADLGQVYYHNREYEKAKEYCLKSLEIYPDFSFAHIYLHYIYLQTGEYDKAVESYIKQIEINTNLAAAAAGRKEHMAEEHEKYRHYFREGGIEGFLLKPLMKQPGFNGGKYYLSAMRNAFLGNKQIALDHLEKAVESRFFMCPFAKADPVFDKLRDEPRYQEILRKMNLQD